MKHEEQRVYGGVDTHQDVHVAAVVSEIGTLLGTKSFPTTPLGLKSLERWMSKHGTLVKVGVEGTGTYGLGLQRVLQAAGHEVVEVNRPNRQLRRAKGKSDTIDAQSAASAVLAGHATAAPKAHDGIVEAIRVLLVAHTSSKQALQKVDARIRSLTVTAPDVIRIDLANQTAPGRAAKAARLRPGDDPADIATATRTALRLLGRQHQMLTEDMTTIEAQLEELTTRANPGLRQVVGVGPVVAATLLVAAGDNPDRMTSEAAFAALCGVSPVPASSGKTTAMRLNRGGNRQANSALFRIAIVRLSHRHPATVDYVARRTAEGKTKRAILRCLKRFIAREIYSHLVNPKPAIQTDDLRARRTAIGQPMRVVALAIGAHLTEISRLERGTNHDAALAQRYRDWIQNQEAAS
jgi:transposase